MRLGICIIIGSFLIPMIGYSQNSKPEPVAGWAELRKKAEQNPIVDSILNEKGLVVAFYTVEISKKGKLKWLSLDDEGPLNGEATKILTELLQTSKWNPMLSKGKPKGTVYEFSFAITKESNKAKTVDSLYKAQRLLYDSLKRFSSDTMPDGRITDSAANKIISQYGFKFWPEMPRYPGGDAAFVSYVEKSFKYPERCSKAKISGKVIVRFILDPYGQPKSIHLADSSTLCPEFNKEAIRVIRDSQSWIPSVWQGYYIKSWRQIPIMIYWD